MYAHPFLTFPMPENIPADLRYPIVAHLNKKQCDFTTTPTDLMELVKLCVTYDDEGLITSVVKSSADDEGLITVGTSHHFPHLYFLQSSTTRRWEQFIREELIINLYNMWRHEADAFDTLGHSYREFPSPPLAVFVHKDKDSRVRIITTDGGDGGHSEVCYVAYDEGYVYIGHKENNMWCTGYPIASIIGAYPLIHTAFEHMLKGEGAEVVPNTNVPLTRLYAQLDAYELDSELDSELEESDERELWYVTPTIEDCDLDNTVTFGYCIDEGYIYITTLDKEADKDPTHLHRFGISALMPTEQNSNPSWLTR